MYRGDTDPSWNPPVPTIQPGSGAVPYPPADPLWGPPAPVPAGDPGGAPPHDPGGAPPRRDGPAHPDAPRPGPDGPRHLSTLPPPPPAGAWSPAGRDATAHDVTPHGVTPHGVTPHGVTAHDAAGPGAAARPADDRHPALRDGHVAVQAVGVTKAYGRGDTAVHALAGVTVAVPYGRFTAVMGPSGSGKSTLMHCMAGLDRPTGGQVLIGGTDLGALSDRQLTRLRRDRIGFVFQQFNLLPTLTAGENIELPLHIARRRADRDWLRQVVGTVGLGDRLGHRPAQLSGGQQQRVAVARALITRPDVVFADEPTGNLDSRAAAEILGFLRRCVDEHGQTIVMVTHDPVAASWADNVLFLADGRLVDELREPTAAGVLDRMKALGA